MRLALTIEIHRAEDGELIARCLEFDLTTSGRTMDEAINNARRMVDGYLEGLQQKGWLQKVLSRLADDEVDTSTTATQSVLDLAVEYKLAEQRQLRL